MNHRKTLLWRCLWLVLCGLSACSTPSVPPSSTPPCRLLIKTQEAGWSGPGLIEHLQARSGGGVLVVRAMGGQWWALTVTPRQDLGCAAIIERLKEDPRLLSVDVDRVAGPLRK